MYVMSPLNLKDLLLVVAQLDDIEEPIRKTSNGASGEYSLDKVKMFISVSKKVQGCHNITASTIEV